LKCQATWSGRERAHGRSDWRLGGQRIFGASVGLEESLLGDVLRRVENGDQIGRLRSVLDRKLRRLFKPALQRKIEKPEVQREKVVPAKPGDAEVRQRDLRVVGRRGARQHAPGRERRRTR